MSAPNASFFELSAYVDAKVLAAGVAETVTVPAGKSVALITPNADVWVKRTGSAAVPAADVADGTASTLIAAGVTRALDVTRLNGALAPLSSFSILSAGVAVVCIEWF
jgi:hypothetical protein